MPQVLELCGIVKIIWGKAHGFRNSFTDISDAAKAQQLADRFDSTKLCRRLDAFAGSVSPFPDTVQKKFGQGCFWCMDQCGSATDIMFKERSFLEDIYPSLVGHAFYDFSCTDVFTFMGLSREACSV